VAARSLAGVGGLRLAVAIAAVCAVTGAPAVGRAQPVPAPAVRNHAAQRQDLFIDVPLDHYTPDVVFPFGGSHHQLPGVVAVDHAPYYCVPHKITFRERAEFIAHLRTQDGLTDDEIARALLVDHGQVRYPGR